MVKLSYIITGGTGHIGNNLARMLCDAGEDVKLLVRKMQPSIQNINANIIICDLKNEEEISQIINENDIVIHLVGVIDVKNKLTTETYDINYKLVKSIYQVALKNKAKHFIYCSTVDCIYKENPNDIIVEPKTIEPEKFKDNYPYTKALATKFFLEEIKKNQMTISIIYPSAVIGINDYKPSLIGKVIIDCIKGKTEFGIDGGYNFIDCLDVSRAIMRIAKCNESDTYILSGHNVTVSELYNYINKCLGKKRKIWKIPYFIVCLSMPFVPYLSKFTLKTLRENHNYNANKAFKKLNFQLTPIEETIKMTVDWFIEHI